jgi:ABC-type Fe3+ transport system substrate-binding protein
VGPRYLKRFIPAAAAAGAAAGEHDADRVEEGRPRPLDRERRRGFRALLFMAACHDAAEFPVFWPWRKPKTSVNYRPGRSGMVALSDRVLLRCLALTAASGVICSAPTRAQSIDELYRNAKDEKIVVLYGAGPTGSHDRWIKDFEQQFPGVTVTFNGGLSTALNKKIEAQLASGKVETDLAILQTIQDFAKWKKAGAMLPFKPAGWDLIDEAYKDDDGAFVTVSVNAITYATNTQWVAAADVPKSALDFLKPLFAGKLVTTDPSDDDAALAVFNSIVQKYGWSYMDKYTAQKPAYVTTGHAAVSNAIVSGDKLASFDSTTTTWQLMRAGKPIAGVFSEADATPIFLVGAGIFKDAPHPNAAKLYLTWYLAKEQQSRSGAFSARSDVPPPPGFKPLASYNIDRGYRRLVTDEARVAELRKRLATYTGQR